MATRASQRAIKLIRGVRVFYTARGHKMWETSDGRQSGDAIVANARQLRLNGLVTVQAPKPRTRRIETVGTSPQKRRAIRALIIKYNLSESSTCIISANRLINAIATQNGIVKDLTELAKMV